MLKVEGLEVVRGRFRLRVDRLLSSRVTVLLGRNGSGKSTFLKTVAGFIKPARGLILLDGRDITNVPAYKRQIGYISQEPIKLPFKPRQAIQYFAELFHIDSRQVIDKMRLEETLKKEKLSLGESQIIALAVLIMRGPRLLLLDEPTAGLDFLNRLNFWDIIKSLDIPMVYVTHDPIEASIIADDIYYIEDGVISGPFKNKLKHKATQYVMDLNIYLQLNTNL